MRLLALRDEIAGIVRSALPRARLAVEIADDLIAYPILSVADAQRRFGRSNQANRNAVACSWSSVYSNRTATLATTASTGAGACSR